MLFVCFGLKLVAGAFWCLVYYLLFVYYYVSGSNLTTSLDRSTRNVEFFFNFNYNIGYVSNYLNFI